MSPRESKKYRDFRVFYRKKSKKRERNLLFSLFFGRNLLIFVVIAFIFGLLVFNLFFHDQRLTETATFSGANDESAVLSTSDETNLFAEAFQSVYMFFANIFSPASRGITGRGISMFGTGDAPTHNAPVLNTTGSFNYSENNLTAYNISTTDSEGDGVKNIYNWWVAPAPASTPVMPLFLLHTPFDTEPVPSATPFTRDYSGRGQIGYIYGPQLAATSGFDKFGCYDFNGVSDSINFSSTVATGAENFSVVFWLSIASPTPSPSPSPEDFRHGVMGNRDNSGNGWDFYYESTQSGRNISFVPGQLNFSRLSQNTWYQVAVVYVKGGTSRLYINGSEVESGSFTINAAVNNLLIGRTYLNKNFTNGSIDEVMIFNRSLSAEQIRAMYQRGNISLIVSQETREGDDWKVEVTPTDGTTDGLSKNSSLLGVSLESEVYECGTLDTENTTYTLMGNVSSTGTCFNVTANNVTLNGQGFNVTFNTGGVPSTSGVSVVRYNQTRIRNVLVFDFWGGSGDGIEGITFFYSNGSGLENVSVVSRADTSMGIKAYGSLNLTIINSRINATGSSSNGIYLGYGNNDSYFRNVSVKTSGSFAHGIYCFQCDKEHIVFNLSNISVSGSNAYAFYFNAGNGFRVNVFDSYVESQQSNQTFFDINSLLGIVNLTNVTMAKRTVNFFDATSTSRLNVHHYLDFYVNDTDGLAISNSNVTARNLTNRVIFSELTNASGDITRRGLLEYMQDVNGIVFSTNYTVNASASGYRENSTSVNLSLSRKGVLTLYTQPANPPTHNDPILNATSSNNYTSENLTAYNISTSDPEGDAVKNIYNWWYNGTGKSLVEPLLLLNMPFEVSTSNTTFTKDYSGRGNHGKVYRVFNSSAGVDGWGAYDFNNGSGGGYEYINLSTSLTNSLREYTIMFWMKPANIPASSYAGVMSNANGSGGWSIDFWMNALSGAGSYPYYSGSGCSLGAASNFSNNIWNHVAIVIKEGGTSSIFHNAVLNDSDTGCRASNTSWNLTIGFHGQGSNWWFNGSLDELIIVNRSLSAEQIRAMYQRQKFDRLVFQETRVGDGWKVEVTPTDDSSDGVPKNSSLLTVKQGYYVYECGVLDIVDGNYTLMNNVSSAGTCFNITANNVTLNCQGFMINYSYADVGGYGVFNSQQNYTTIHNCVIKEGNVTGYDSLYIANSNNVTIKNNTIIAVSQGSYGIHLYLSGGDTSIISNRINVSGNSSYGIYVWFGNNHSIENNSINVLGYITDGIILISSSNNQINYNDIKTYGQTSAGINLWSGGINNNLLANSFWTNNTNSYAFYLSSTDSGNNFSLRDSVINSTLSYDFYAESEIETGVWNFTNVTFSDRLIETGANGTLRVYWYLDTYVNYTNGSLASNANVTIVNRTGSVVFSGLTNNSGDLNRRTLLEYWQNFSTTVFSTNYNLNATKQYYQTTDNLVNLTNSRKVTLMLSQPWNLTSCGELNLADTTYRLLNDVSSSLTCFNITANNVTLDGQGYNITWTGSGVDDGGIKIFGVNYTKIRNTLIFDMAEKSDQYAIYAQYTNKTEIYNVSAFVRARNGYVFRIENSENLNISNSNIFLNWTILNTANDALYLDKVNNSQFTNLNVTSRDFGGVSRAVYLNGSNNLFRNFTVLTSFNSQEGVYAFGHNNSFYDFNVTTYGSSSDGFVVSGNSVNMNNIKVNTYGGSYSLVLTGNISLWDGYAVTWDSTYEFYFSNSTPYTVNLTNFTHTYQRFLEVNTTLKNYWHTNVYVNYSNGSLASNANVTISNRTGSVVYSELTNLSGEITRQPLLEYWQNKTVLSFATNYTINATKAGFSPSEKPVNLTTNRREVLTLGIDSTPPTITILSPVNQTYTSNNISINVTADEDITGCLFSVNGAANVSMTRGNATNYYFYNVTGDGSRNVIVACNDTANLYGSSNLVHYSVDTVNPSVTVLSPTNASYASLYVVFNVSGSEDLTRVYYSVNGAANQSMTRVNGTNYWANYTNSQGSYNVIFSFNDTANRWGASSLIHFSVDVNDAPRIDRVFDVGSQDVLQGGARYVNVTYIVIDDDGPGNIDNNTANANFTKSGETDRFNSTCYRKGENLTAVNFTCSVPIWYWDGAGTWNISVGIKDLAGVIGINVTSTFVLSETVSAELYPSQLNFGSIFPGDFNRTPYYNLTLNNTGNFDFNGINITAVDLLGESDSSRAIYAGNISIGTITGVGLPQCTDANSNRTVNGTNVTVTGAALLSGNLTQGGGIAQEELYMCIRKIGSELTQQTYSTGTTRWWEIALFLAVIAPADAFRRRRKNRKADSLNSELVQSRLSVFGAVSEIVDEVAKKYGLERQDVVSSVVDIDKRGVLIPVSVFESEAGMLEVLCKYMKENIGLRYSEIAKLLNRDDRTVWTACNKANKKIKKIRDDKKKSILMPSTIFLDTRLSVFEAVVLYLRKRRKSYTEIAKLLGRDARNVWTTGKRAERKMRKE